MRGYCSQHAFWAQTCALLERRAPRGPCWEVLGPNPAGRFYTLLCLVPFQYVDLGIQFFSVFLHLLNIFCFEVFSYTHFRCFITSSSFCHTVVYVGFAFSVLFFSLTCFHTSGRPCTAVFCLHVCGVFLFGPTFHISQARLSDSCFHPPVIALAVFSCSWGVLFL